MVTKKRIIFSIITGLAIFVIGSVITNLISFRIFADLASKFPPSELLTVRNSPPYVYLSWLTTILRILTATASGGLTGYLIRKNGWFWGASIGLSMAVLSIITTIFGLLYPSLIFGDRITNEYARVLRVT